MQSHSPLNLLKSHNPNPNLQPLLFAQLNQTNHNLSDKHNLLHNDQHQSSCQNQLYMRRNHSLLSTILLAQPNPLNLYNPLHKMTKNCVTVSIRHLSKQ